MTIDQTTGLGATGARGASTPMDKDPSPSTGLAWQREMERAQLSTWFHPPLMNGADARATATPLPLSADRIGPNAARPALMVMPPSQALPNAAAQAAYGMPSSSLAPDAAPELASHTRPLASTINHLNITVTAAIVKDLLLEQDLAAPASSAPRGVSHEGAATKPPGLSVHIEPHAHGVAVWVGVPGIDPLPEARVVALLQALRQNLRQQGVTLQSLTVNGQSLWIAPTNTPSEYTPEES